MTMKDYQKDFLDFAVSAGALRFGEFVLKSGRLSPYFFNTGMFNSGAALDRLGEFYARAIQDSGLSPDGLYGPAYKGIPLVAATAIALARAHCRDLPYSFIGAPLGGKILIIDDVISAGTSVRESVRIIRAAGATPIGVAISLDRQERGAGETSAVQEVREQHGLEVVSIATLDELVAYLALRPHLAGTLEGVQAYRARYGVRPR